MIGNADKLKAAAYAPLAFGLAAQRQGAGQRHHERARNRRPHDRRPWTAAPAPSCRCRTAATIAAPSASSPIGRGPSRSVPMGVVVEQIKRLAGNGFREIVLTGVDITSYGPDLPGQPTLGKLVQCDPAARAGAAAAAPLLDRLDRGGRGAVSRRSPKSAADAAFPPLAAVGRRHDPQAHEAPAQRADTLAFVEKVRAPAARAWCSAPTSSPAFPPKPTRCSRTPCGWSRRPG